MGREDFFINNLNLEIHIPTPLWRWDVFGGGLLVVELPINPPWWRILLTKIFLGSEWTKLNQ